MSIVQPPPKKRSVLVDYYENYGKRRATDVRKWKITLTGALPGLNQSVQNNTNQTYARSVFSRGCYSLSGLLLVAATVVIVVMRIGRKRAMHAALTACAFSFPLRLKLLM